MPGRGGRGVGALRQPRLLGSFDERGARKTWAHLCLHGQGQSELALRERKELTSARLHDTFWVPGVEFAPVFLFWCLAPGGSQLWPQAHRTSGRGWPVPGRRCSPAAVRPGTAGHSAGAATPPLQTGAPRCSLQRERPVRPRVTLGPGPPPRPWGPRRLTQCGQQPDDRTAGFGHLPICRVGGQQLSDGGRGFLQEALVHGVNWNQDRGHLTLGHLQDCA